MDPVRTAHTRAADGSTVADYSYLWDIQGNKSESRDLTSGGSRYSYGYDLAGRMTSWTNTLAAGGGWSTSFTLDDAGNRTATSGNMPELGAYTLSAGAPAPADAQMDQYTTTPFDTRTYDAAGNLLTSDVGATWWDTPVYTRAGENRGSYPFLSASANGTPPRRPGNRRAWTDSAETQLPRPGLGFPAGGIPASAGRCVSAPDA